MTTPEKLPDPDQQRPSPMDAIFAYSQTRLPVTGRAAWIGLALWLLICFVPAVIGAQFPPGEWYALLVKPRLTPPGWVFGPVWTLLYVLMGVAAWQVWRRGGIANASRPLGLFVVQLTLNGLWSYLFFGLRRPDLALGDIVLLWTAILATFLAFRRHHRPAGLLLLPYLLWVSFAAYLNFMFWRLNP